MLLALDVGNTNTVLGLYSLDASASLTDSAKLVAHWRVSTHRTQTADEYGVLFRSSPALALQTASTRAASCGSAQQAAWSR